MLALQKMFVNSEDYCFATQRSCTVLSKKDIQMPKLAFQNFVASDPNGAFLLVPVVYAQAIKNAQLLVHANIDKDYHDLMAMVVCDLNTKMCMIQRCENCPGDNNIREYLDGTFADSEEEEISFQQWQGTDRAMLCTQTTSIIEFLELLVDAISKLTVHSFIAKCQARYLKKSKRQLAGNIMFALLDF